MRKPLFLLLCFLLLTLGIASPSAATPISFDIDGPGSSVSISQASWGDTTLTHTMAPDLDSQIFTLGDGGSKTFDFFDLTVSGSGVGVADITANLAFSLPDPITASGSSDIAFWFTCHGYFSGGILTWNQPQSVTLSNGDYFDVEFENIYIAGFGDTTTVSATITAHGSDSNGPYPDAPAPVPEPATVVLLGIGLVGIAGVSRIKVRNG